MHASAPVIRSLLPILRAIFSPVFKGFIAAASASLRPRRFRLLAIAEGRPRFDDFIASGRRR